MQVERSAYGVFMHRPMTCVIGLAVKQKMLERSRRPCTRSRLAWVGTDFVIGPRQGREPPTHFLPLGRPSPAPIVGWVAATCPSQPRVPLMSWGTALVRSWPPPSPGDERSKKEGTLFTIKCTRRFGWSALTLYPCRVSLRCSVWREQPPENC